MRFMCLMRPSNRLCADTPVFLNEHALNAARIPLACAWRLSPIMKHPRKYKRPKDSEKEPNPSHVTEEQVIGYLSSISRPESIRQIAHGMELQHHGRRFLPRIIQYLKSRGDVEEIRGGQFRLAESKQSARAAVKRGKSAAAEGEKHTEGDSVSAAGAGARRSADPNLVSGRIVAHRDGYGFRVPDKPIPRVEGDLFIGRDSMADAMHGDRVLARVERRKADGRAEGRVVQILERENPTVVGLFRYGPHGNVVLPYDTRIQHEVSIPPGDGLTPELREKVGATQAGSSAAASHRRLRLPELDGAVVNVEITRYPKGGLAPAGRGVDILGRPGDIGGAVEIIILKNHLPHIFPAEVIAEAQSTPQGVFEADLRGRRDFRDLPIVTIDGETARDFDDAVHVTERPSGRYELM